MLDKTLVRIPSGLLQLCGFFVGEVGDVANKGA